MQRQPLKVFLSYSRRDMEVADRLVSLLEKQGIEVLIDRRDLPYGEEWQKELADFIRLSDTVIWLVSPDSIASKWVNWELGEVGRLSKRMIPVRVREIDPGSLPEALGKIHLLPAEGAFDFDRHFTPLVETINTDHAWLKDSTRLADRARQWMAKDRDKGLLLYGRALGDAETWSQAKPLSVPPISSEILELILNSRRETARRQRRFIAVAVVGLGLAFFAWQQRNAALVNKSTELAELARDNLDRGDAGTSLLLAMSALPEWRFALDRPYVPAAGRSLYNALLSLREAKVLRGHTADVNTVRFSSDDRLVVTSSDDRTARLWDAATGSTLRIFGPHAGKVLQADFSPDGALVETLTEDNKVHVWDVKRGELRRTSGHKAAAITAVADSTGSRTATFSGNDASISDAEGREIARFTKKGSPIASMVLCPAGRCLIITDTDGRAELWDGRNGDGSIELKGHAKPIMKVAIGPDGKRAATVAMDGLALLWDVETGSKVLDLAGHTNVIFDAAFAHSGEFLATASRDRTARIWRIPAPATTRSRTNLEPARSIGLSNDGNRVALGAHDGTIRLLGNGALDEIASAKLGNVPVTFVAFDSAGGRLLAGSESGEIAVYSVPRLAPIFRASTDGSEVGGGGFDPSGTGVSVLTTKGARFDFDERGASRRASAAAGGDDILVATFSPDLKRALIGRFDGRADIVDLGGGTRPLEGHGGAILHAVFDKAGKRVATASEDGTARLWDADTGRMLQKLEGFDAPVMCVAVSGDGNFLATASPDRTVRLWSFGHSLPVATYRGHLAPVELVRLLPDRSGIISASEDGEIHRWEFSDDYSAMLRRARLAVPRCLTEEQTTQFGLPPDECLADLKAR